MRIIIALLAVASLSGCAAMQDRREIAWQALHAVDALNTDTYRSDPCLYEAHPLTRRLIGREPSRASVVAWGVGGAALHAGVTQMLIDTDHPRALAIWEWMSITDSGISVALQFRDGVRPFGGNVEGCGR